MGLRRLVFVVILCASIPTVTFAESPFMYSFQAIGANVTPLWSVSHMYSDYGDPGPRDTIRGLGVAASADLLSAAVGARLGRAGIGLGAELIELGGARDPRGYVPLLFPVMPSAYLVGLLGDDEQPNSQALVARARFGFAIILLSLDCSLTYERILGPVRVGVQASYRTYGLWIPETFSYDYKWFSLGFIVHTGGWRPFGHPD